MEEWKDFYNYKVSNYGNVSNGKRILKKFKAKGYLQTQIFIEGNRCSYYIHRLVAHLFLNMDLKYEGIQVDHLDNNKENNHVSNLDLVNHRENISKRNLNKASKYVGVSKNRSKYASKVKYKNRLVHLGTFNTEEEAAKAYNNFLANNNITNKYNNNI